MASCASPNGPMYETVISPPSYGWLQTNGYCNPGSYGKNGTVCWTFVNPGTCVSLNSGYAVSGCASGSFGPFNLYTCNPGCVLVGTTLNVCSLTPGACYTWCMTYSASGPPGCGYTDFCPYYQNTTPLPVELLYFRGYYDNINILEWESTSNINNNYYTLEVSSDSKNWTELVQIQDDGIGVYQYRDQDFFNQVNYYRLKQTDFDGTSKYHGIVSIDNSLNLGGYYEVFNMVGVLISFGEGTFNLDALIAPQGLYFVKIYTSNVSQNCKILKVWK